MLMIHQLSSKYNSLHTVKKFRAKISEPSLKFVTIALLFMLV